MNDLAALEDAPRFEPIQTMHDQRRERERKTRQRNRKGHCYKRPYSRKQALSQRSSLIAHGKAKQELYTYKCGRCDFWHLTHQPPRQTP